MRSGILALVYVVYVLSFIVVLTNSCTHKSVEADYCNPGYSTDIEPIITKKCTLSGCHGAGSTIADFTNFVVLKTLADNGTVLNRVFVLKIMPPANIDTLTTQEKVKLKCWLDNGAQK